MGRQTEESEDAGVASLFKLTVGQFCRPFGFTTGPRTGLMSGPAGGVQLQFARYAGMKLSSTIGTTPRPTYNPESSADQKRKSGEAPPPVSIWP